MAHNPYRDDFTLALDNARKAMSKGNLAQANQWTRLAERHLAITYRLATIMDAQNPLVPGR
ncbi:MAG: hypothetical protein Q8R02_22415 [Hyphomonadaceae bacterium]|nr:hypothetical protein [Hyphomonadaceae bacterium]